MNRLALWLFFLSAACVRGQGNPAAIPAGYTVPSDSCSPDGRYGVTVPVLAAHLDNGEFQDPDDSRNRLVEVPSGRVVATVDAGFVGWDRMNHDEVLPSRWSADSSTLVWQIDGKWSDAALVVLRLQHGRLLWQTNVLAEAQRAILARTKKAAPRKYALVRRTNVGMGTMGPDQVGGVDDPRSAYPEGFSIQVDVVGPVTFPLYVTAELTSEAKPGTPMYGVLASHLTGLLDARGKLMVTGFHLGPARPSHF